MSSQHPTSRLNPTLLAEEMKYLRELAQKAGRDQDAIGLTLRWNALPALTDEFAVEKVAQRLREYKEAGVKHVCFDLNIPQPSSLPVMLETMERLIQCLIPRLSLEQMSFLPRTSDRPARECGD